MKNKLHHGRPVSFEKGGKIAKGQIIDNKEHFNSEGERVYNICYRLEVKDAWKKYKYHTVLLPEKDFKLEWEPWDDVIDVRNMEEWRSCTQLNARLHRLVFGEYTFNDAFLPDYCHSLDAANKIIDELGQYGWQFHMQMMLDGKRAWIVGLSYSQNPFLSWHENISVRGESWAHGITAATIMVPQEAWGNAREFGQGDDGYAYFHESMNR